LTATSANISGKKGSTKINDILKQFKNKKILPDLILDDNNLKPSPPSTVIDLTNFKILRRGAISKKEILKYD
jgi:tRNA A37 threonylcarbamoyladenosine synthetase subunit TsaC/SUA5/YrdC